MVTRIASRILVSTTLALTCLIMGCEGKSPAAPSRVRPGAPRITAISPNIGSVRGGDVVSIIGAGFREGLTAKAGGVPMTLSSITNTSIAATMPAHAEGLVDVVVTNQDGQTGSLPAAFTYAVMPDPAITDVSPKEGTTSGGMVLVITGAAFRPGATVSINGIVIPAVLRDLDRTRMTVTTPPHAAGAVDIVVTNPDGSSGRLIGGYTYVSPVSWDVNGTWKGQSDHLTDNHVGLDLVFTVENNAVITLSCGPTTLTFSPALRVEDGQFSFSGEGGVSLSGTFLSPTAARGRIRVPPCGDSWYAQKR